MRKTFDDGLFVEAGATHVASDPDLLALLTKIHLRVIQPKRPRGLAKIVVGEGARRRFAPNEEPPSHELLSDEERKLGFRGCLEKYFADMTNVSTVRMFAEIDSRIWEGRGESGMPIRIFLSE